MKLFPQTILLISIVTCLSLFNCNTSESAGIEITNGNSVGTIYNEDSTVAVGALVRLIPSGYDPMARSATSARPDSTITDQNGRYTFKVTQSDFYNIIAEKANASCLQDSLALLSDIGNIIESDTLEETGWLMGSIEVKPGGNPGLAVLLLPGTNIYTSPGDSTGNFPRFPCPRGATW